MGRVAIQGIRRPGLAAALAARGLAVARAGEAGDLLFARDHTPAHGPAPLVVEVVDPGDAAALLDAGVAEVVCAGDADTLAAARLAGVWRRRCHPRIAIGDLVIDPVARRASAGGRPLPLLPREFAMLACLAAANGAVVARERLLAEVCGRRFDPGTNVLAVHVSRLRAKMGEAPTTPRLLAVRGAGYRLAATFAGDAQPA